MKTPTPDADPKRSPWIWLVCLIVSIFACACATPMEPQPVDHVGATPAPAPETEPVDITPANIFPGPTPEVSALIRPQAPPTQPPIAELEWLAADLSALEAELEALGFGGFGVGGSGVGGGGSASFSARGSGALVLKPGRAAVTGARWGHLPEVGVFNPDDESLETWQRAQARPNTSRLLVGDEDALPLQQLQASVRVDGTRARVVLEFDFLNTRSQSLEGVFELRLPSGATPFFLAFDETVYQSEEGVPGDPPPLARGALASASLTPDDIMKGREGLWEQPKLARMVSPRQARQAFREIVKERIDPALLEWAGAGVFRVHVFPITPERSHRVIVGYDVDLLRVGDRHALTVELPKDVARRSINLDIAAPEGIDVTLPAGVTLTRDGDRMRGQLTGSQADRVEVSLRASAPILMVGSDPGTGLEHFAARWTPEIPALPADAQSRHAVLMVDVSLSANPDQYNVWLALMEALLENNRDQIDGFAVVFFNIEQHWWRESFTANTPENVEALMKYARTLSLEGATDLGGALSQAASPSWLETGEGPLRELFLLSDGAVTWGEQRDRALHQRMANARVGALYAYRAGFEDEDLERLDALTQSQGGAIFSVVGEAELVAASRGHRSRPWRLLGVEVDGTESGETMVKGRPHHIFKGQELLLVGRGRPAADARVTLTLQAPGAAPQMLMTTLSPALESPLATRLYGQTAVAALERFGEPGLETATRYARHFRVAGRSASLLMLESEADYARFGVESLGVEDVSAIKTTKLLAKLVEMEAALAPRDDPRALFFAHLDAIAEGGVALPISSEVEATLEVIPTGAFEVPPSRLVAKSQAASALPEAFREALLTRALPEATLTAEAERRLAIHGEADALKVLSTLLELHPGDPVVAREVAFRAMEWSLPKQAYHLLQSVARSHPDQPQTYRALANVLASSGQHELAIAYFEVGMAGEWDSNAGDFHAIHAVDYMRFLRKIALGEAKTSLRRFALHRLKALQDAHATGGVADLLVSITWNTDDSDLDLHVIDPTGFQCYYSEPEAPIGGTLTADVTQGFGPEMFIIPQAVDGTYDVKIKYFGSPGSRTRTRTRAHVLVVEAWGTTEEKVLSEQVVTLEKEEDIVDVIKVEIDGRRPYRRGILTEQLARFESEASVSERYEVETEFQSNEVQDALEECLYNAMLAPEIGEGELTMRMSFSGEALEIEATRNEINPEAAACFVEVLKNNSAALNLPEGDEVFTKTWALELKR